MKMVYKPCGFITHMFKIYIIIWETVNKAKNFKYVLKPSKTKGQIYLLLDTENISEPFDKCFWAASESNTGRYGSYMRL